ncbi:hypothetical protein A4A49_38449 [Nicotiana attenuata]|uniref:Uncharacterized protein n=1 Tax=Nicotiana attenuata TaxID=49451 RepID=A0A1J6KFW7_NICAT|nr:hypothetical protein A4A49_38449 [Nicotiana attenuata]
MIQNQRFEVQNEGKMKKDQVGSSKETLPKKQKQKGDDFESNIILSKNSVSRNPNHALRDNNIDNNSKLLMKDGKDIDYHVQQGIPASAMLSSKNIIDLNKPPNENEEESCKEVIQNKRPLEHNGSINEKEQEGSFEEELPEKQQQEQDNGEPEVNRVTCEDRLPDDLDYNVNSGSKLLTRDEKDKKYYIKQGIPRSIKFRCMTNLYKETRTRNRNTVITDINSSPISNAQRSAIFSHNICSLTGPLHIYYKIIRKSASATVKLREVEMKAALQLIQLSDDSCSSRDDVESSVQGYMKNMEEESTRFRVGLF